MFHPDFFPTPVDVIERMLSGISLYGKVVYDPSGGKGDIAVYAYQHGAKEVLSSEISTELQKILSTRSKIIGSDFFEIEACQISHVDIIVMNPPFSKGDLHILHAFEIAPPGCSLFALCNTNTLKNPHYRSRMELVKLVECFGSYESLGQCFRNAERHTDVEVSLIRLKKPCPSYETEFDGFFLEEEQEQQADAIMPYNLIRDLVNRYVGAVKTFDQQIEAAVKMNQLTEGFFKSPIAMSLTQDGVLKTRNDFKKDFQKAAWDYLFEKLNMQHYATRGLKEYINQFVEQQAHIPFTMANIYRMLEIVIGTQESRMDKALLEIFDKITKHHDENRYYVEGWKTNSHFLVGKQFILPGLCYQDPRYNKGSSKIEMAHGDQMDFIDDLIKGLCHLSGSNYKRMGNLASWVRSPVRIVTDQEVFYCHEAAGWQGQASREEALRRAGIPYTVVNDKPMYGEWFDWAFFRCKAFKKGSMHFEFKDPKLWELFNQRIAKIKGYALFEAKEQTAYQKRRTGRK